jgi:hypothetical protein
MVRIKTVWYWKRYMRKNRYRCKRYRLYLPKSIGEAIDTDLEYVARLMGSAIVIVPKGLENFFSRLEKLESVSGENTTNGRAGQVLCWKTQESKWRAISRGPSRGATTILLRSWSLFALTNLCEFRSNALVMEPIIPALCLLSLAAASVY